MNASPIRVAAALAAVLAAGCGGAASGPAAGAPPPVAAPGMSAPAAAGGSCERLMACNAAIVETLCARLNQPNCKALFSLQLSGIDAAVCQMSLDNLAAALAPYQERVKGWEVPPVCRP